MIPFKTKETKSTFIKYWFGHMLTLTHSFQNYVLSDQTLCFLNVSRISFDDTQKFMSFLAPLTVERVPPLYLSKVKVISELDIYSITFAK